MLEGPRRPFVVWTASATAEAYAQTLQSWSARADRTQRRWKVSVSNSSAVAVVGPLIEFLLPLHGKPATPRSLRAKPRRDREDFRPTGADIANQSQDDWMRFAAIFDTRNFARTARGVARG
jgi:hypothetical protein